MSTLLHKLLHAKANHFRTLSVAFGKLYLFKKITTTQSDSISQLKFWGEYDVAHGKQFKETTIGGLSGIDYDAQNDIYYMISDDRSAINLGEILYS